MRKMHFCIFVFVVGWNLTIWIFTTRYVFCLFCLPFPALFSSSTKTFMYHKIIEFRLFIHVIKNYLEMTEKMVKKCDFIWFFKSRCRKYQKSSEKKYPEKLSQTLLSLSSPQHACRHTFDLFKTICFEHFDLNTTTGLHVLL